MLNSNDWQGTSGQFLEDSQALLYKLEECISHLELIGDDEDAVSCLIATLDSLGSQARQAGVASLETFSGRLSAVLSAPGSGRPLQDEARSVLKNCLTLIAWQLELIDPRTGELPLDSDEQQDLLDRLAHACGLSELADPTYDQTDAPRPA